MLPYSAKPGYPRTADFFFVDTANGLNFYPKERRGLERLAQLFRDLQLKKVKKIGSWTFLSLFGCIEVTKVPPHPPPPPPPPRLNPPPPPLTYAAGTAAIVKCLKMSGSSGSDLPSFGSMLKNTFLELGQSGLNISGAFF